MKSNGVAVEQSMHEWVESLDVDLLSNATRVRGVAIRGTESSPDPGIARRHDSERSGRSARAARKHCVSAVDPELPPEQLRVTETGHELASSCRLNR